MVLVYLVVVQLLVLDVHILYGMKHRETSSVAPLVRAVFCAQPFYRQPKVLCVCASCCSPVQAARVPTVSEPQ
jgi:hypothetical protein